MSNTEPVQPITPSSNPDMFRYFAFIVDGEVGFRVAVTNHEDFAPSIACLLSNPTIVELTGMDVSQVKAAWRNHAGSTYDGQNFHPPIE
jgi:hypothetical protein